MFFSWNNRKNGCLFLAASLSRPVVFATAAPKITPLGSVGVGKLKSCLFPLYRFLEVDSQKYSKCFCPLPDVNVTALYSEHQAPCMLCMLYVEVPTL